MRISYSYYVSEWLYDKEYLEIVLIVEYAN